MDIADKSRSNDANLERFVHGILLSSK